MNKITIIGNLTKDPELRQVKTSDGTVSVCDFTVAANGKRKGDESTFFRCTAWRGLAELIGKYCSKGKKVCVIGQVAAHAYTGKDGPRAEIDVTVEDFEFCSPRGEAYDNDLKDEGGFTKVNDEDGPF